MALPRITQKEMTEREQRELKRCWTTRGLRMVAY